MQIKYGKYEFALPDSLNEITIASKIEFQAKYGKLLSDKYKSLPEGELAQLEECEYVLTASACHIAHYGGINYDSVFKSFPYDLLMQVYHESLVPLIEQEQAINLVSEIEYSGEIWQLTNPILTNGTQLTAGQFATAKRIIQQLVSIGNGNYEALPYLCAIYLQKKGEAYNEALIDERVKLFRNMSLADGLKVGFFLRSCLNLLKLITAYSNQIIQSQT